MKDMFLAEELGYDSYEPYPSDENILTEKDFLNQQLKKLDKKVIDLTWRLANYENSKIIRFLHFIKIL